jgi:hypothetical protein
MQALPLEVQKKRPEEVSISAGFSFRRNDGLFKDLKFYRLAESLLLAFHTGGNRGMI